MKKISRVNLVLYLLGIYIIFQFVWWMYLLGNLNKENTLLNSLITDAEKSATISRKLWMIGGEGAVFLIILIIGFYQIKKSIRREFQLNEKEKNFMLSITHELKSPLASLKLYLQTLQIRDIKEAQQKEILTKSAKDIDRLESLIENILLAKSVEERKFVLIKRELNLSELLKNEVQKLKETVGTKHETEFRVEDNIFVNADELGVISIVRNLYENAVKYSPMGSKIELDLKKENTVVIFSIKDHGKGISEADEKKVFDKFYRVENEETRSTKGTGLGLFIVNELVRLHQWKISITSKIKMGTIFIIKV